MGCQPQLFTDPPRIKKVIYKQIPDPATQAALLQRGEVAIATELTPRLREQLRNKPGVVHEEIAILIKSACKDLGIEVVLEKLSPAKYQEQYFTRKAYAVLVQDPAWLPDGSYVIGLYFHSTRGIADWINYSNSTVNELLDKGSSSLDFAERARFAKEAYEIVVNEAPWAFYLHTGYHISRRENVKGFVWRTHNLLQFYYFFKD